MTRTGQSSEILLAALRDDFPTLHDDARVRRKLAAAGAAVGAGTLVGTAAEGVAHAASGATVSTFGTPALAGTAGATTKAVAGAKSGAVLASWSALAMSTKAVVAAGTIAVGVGYPAVRYVEGLDDGPNLGAAALTHTTEGSAQSETTLPPTAGRAATPQATSLPAASQHTPLQETAPELPAAAGDAIQTRREVSRVAHGPFGTRGVNPGKLSTSVSVPTSRRAPLGEPTPFGALERAAVGSQRAATVATAAVPPASESQATSLARVAALEASSLREEAALIESALRATQQHDGVAARRALEEHERRFPNGSLAQERARLRAALP